LEDENFGLWLLPKNITHKKEFGKRAYVRTLISLVDENQEYKTNSIPVYHPHMDIRGAP